MLSRVADSIYWMSRYVERAENVARFIDVNLNLTLDMPGDADQQWQPLVVTTGDDEQFRRALRRRRRKRERHPVPDVRPREPELDPVLPARAPARTPAPSARSSRRRCGSRSTSST